MPLLFEIIESDFHIIVYRIDQDLLYYESGIDFTDFDLKEYKNITNKTKQLQWLASRFWIKKISKQQQQLLLEKTELGKPHITNYPIKFSISHSQNCVAVICSETREVSIDIETIQDKVVKIKHKFLHKNDFEQGDNLENLSIIWSAKETIYKRYHTKDLYSFKEQIAIDRFDEISLHYTLSHFSNQKSFEVYFKKLDDLVATWIID